MRLLQLFMSKTADTLSISPKVQKTWRTVVVRLWFKRGFLLQGILAVSALHMANILPVQSNHLCILVASRKDATLHEFRSELDQVTADNCEALFAFSFLIGYFIPASAGTAINPSAHFLKNDFLGSVVEWMRLYFGVGIIHGHQGGKIAKGPLNTFLHEWAHLQKASIDINVEQRALFCVLQLTSRARRYHSQYGLSPEEGHQVQAEANEEIQANSQALKFLIIVFRNSGIFKSNHVNPTSECSFENYNSLNSHINASPDIQ
ncbi:hypothetical protein ASPWEDRAFT_28238 [Aspergillus wentii DTO 134E9]|uniref:Transcription factor domain-containing protein n=1 Tax=Aspergillus wentii DTO 134E9 TaxID=1073089 RepID=A0A1L9RL26_ASPWE|nr:uncharacterized protein ASPWEDRAFT_28238 [Aspergillus wentii DTO 134E9]OJJ35621.1 hypothetical protein ASPWEDRAFT_28238 [Aspergillus wentii DTO 134E9]